jgi:four helix bundle protein
VSAPEAKASLLQKRLVSFASEIVQLSARIPKTPQGSHLSKQLLRSGTAAAANYGEARGAESRADFIHKLRIALKEMNETAIGLQIIVNFADFARKDRCRREGKRGTVPNSCGIR